METIITLNAELFKIIDTLSPEQVRNLHKNLVSNNCYGDDISINNIQPNDIERMKNVVKIGIQKIPIEDLNSFGPEPIRKAIDKFQSQSMDEILGDIGTEASPETQETQEALIKEVISIATQRNSPKEEIPRDLQGRFGYVLAKLNSYYKIPKYKIAELTNIDPRTIKDYAEDALAANPDLKKLWSESAENKANLGVEKTIAKSVTDRAIESIKDTITLGDFIRDKYMIPAVQKGYNLHKRDDILRLSDAAIQLFFSHEKIYLKILEIERRNDELLRENRVLKENNYQLEEIVQVLN